jgi:hypothetical protein
MSDDGAVKAAPGANGEATYLPRWRLDVEDDATITFDRTTQTITKKKTGESCYLGDYRAFAFEEPGHAFVSSSHAPPLGKWYVTGED